MVLTRLLPILLRSLHFLDGRAQQSVRNTQMMNNHILKPTVVSTTRRGIQTTSPNPHIPYPAREKTVDSHSFPSIIPPRHNRRTLVLCFDGTGDQFDADNSNIVQLVSLLKKDDRTKQMVYYQAGFGTHTPTKPATPFMAQIQKTLDQMVAWNLDTHVMNGYNFLVQNYIEGDKICIFGFSRGAYTARSLAGMLHKVGLLPADNFQQVPFAYKMYTRIDHIGWEQSNGFKKVFCVDVAIDFLGLWDTVDSVGLIPKRLPFTTSNTIVRTFRHAISLDERRSKFKINLWNRPTVHESRYGIQASSISQPAQPPESSLSERTPSTPSNPTPFNSSHSPFMKPNNNEKGNNPVKPHTKEQIPRRKRSKRDRVLDTMEAMHSCQNEVYTDIEEVWFAGCHCDVGGGSVSNKTRHSLARIPLRWMIRECFKANTGIMFEANGLWNIGLDPTTLYPFVKPRPPPLPITSEHKIQKPPANPIPIRPHTTSIKKQPTEVNNQHAVAHVPFLGSEEAEELHDALSPAYDQLKINKTWWILEILPLRLRYQRSNNQWVAYFGSNFARPRFIPRQIKNGVKVHRSVKMRMEAEYEDEEEKGMRYKPKAGLRVEPEWID